MSFYYEDLKLGQSESEAHTVTERDIELFGEATGDMNPVHFDEAYARKTVFRGRVAHGALSIGFVSAVIGTKLPGPGTILISANIVFKGPVRIGDMVLATCTVKEIRERRNVLLRFVCAVGGVEVLEGEALVMAPKRPSDKVSGEKAQQS
jgi:3-hydroxybutyryl-CoA dehydratase